MNNKGEPAEPTEVAAHDEIEENQSHRFHRLVKATLGLNTATFLISLLNDLAINHAPVSFSQMLMEGTDTILPGTLSLAEREEQRKRTHRAVGWRAVTNSVHIGAAAWGAYEATKFFGEPAEFSSANVAISGLVATANLGILRHMRRHHQHTAHTEAITPELAFEDPIEVTEDVIAEARAVPHIKKSRNLENLEACAITNVVEAVPAFVGPLAQMGWENGSATSVLVSNIAVGAMMGYQSAKDGAMLWRESRNSPGKPGNPACISEPMGLAI